MELEMLTSTKIIALILWKATDVYIVIEVFEKIDSFLLSKSII